jgi:hypothetical protein
MCLSIRMNISYDNLVCFVRKPRRIIRNSRFNIWNSRFEIRNSISWLTNAEQHEPHIKPEVNACVPDKLAVPATLVTSVLLMARSYSYTEIVWDKICFYGMFMLRLTNYCLTFSEQYFSNIQDENTVLEWHN